MIKIFKAIDIYGDPIKLQFNNEFNLKSSLGGCLTIITIIAGFVFSWLIGKDIFYKVKPYSYQQNTIYENSPSIYINRTSFPLFFEIQNNFESFNYERYLNFTMNYVSMERNNLSLFEMKEVKNLKLIKADSKNFSVILEEDFKKRKLSNFLTIDSYDNFEIAGYFNQDLAKFLSIVVTECDIATFPDFCATHEEIDSFINKNIITFHMIYKDYQLSITDYDNPTKYFMVNPFNTVNNESKDIKFFIEQDTLQTDSGFIFEELSDQNYLRMVESNYDTRVFNSNTKDRVIFSFFSANRSNFIFRKYIKIHEILASIGGLLQVILKVFQFLNSPFCTINKNSTLIDFLFSKEEDLILHSSESFKISKFKNSELIGDKKLNPSGEILKVKTFSNLNNNDKSSNTKDFINQKNFMNLNLRNDIHTFEALNNYIQNYKKIKYDEENKLSKKLTYWLKISTVCRKIKKCKSLSNRYIEFYEEAKNYTENFFDYIKVVKYINEFDHFKKIFMNQNQQKLFSLIRVKLYNQQKNTFMFDSYKEEINAEQIIRNIQENSEIDKNIIKLIIS
jgi:hypothetical protein